jgi:hypothetical protein
MSSVKEWELGLAFFVSNSNIRGARRVSGHLKIEGGGETGMTQMAQSTQTGLSFSI